MSLSTRDKSTVTKRDLATRVRAAVKPQIKLQQAEITELITQTLDAIRDSLSRGQTVELRNFGVFKIETRKERVGRNPKNPDVDIQIPERSVVKFRPGKEMKQLLLNISPSQIDDSTESSNKL